MNNATLSPHSEERTVAILFCEVVSFEGSINQFGDVPEDDLMDGFDERFRELLGEQNGTLVSRIQESFTAIFDTAPAAAKFALATQKSLASVPIHLGVQVLGAKIFIHFSDVKVEKTKRGLRLTGTDVGLAARLTPTIPDGGIGISDEIRSKLPTEILMVFRQMLGSANHITGTAVSSLPTGWKVWLHLADTAYPRRSVGAKLELPLSERPPAVKPQGGSAQPMSSFAHPAVSGLQSQDLANNPVTTPAPIESERSGNMFTKLLRRFEPPPSKTLKPTPLGLSRAPDVIDCASEAIVVIDIVQATATSDLFGWYSVGRHSVRHLRQAVREIGGLYGLACMKSTGDGLLLTYRDDKAADLAAVNAVQASLDLLKRLSDRNETAPEERQIAIRLALHFGEVDVLPDDREGPNVSFTFRVEAINHASLDKALNPIDSALLPSRDYILCSERIHDIVERRKPEWHKTSCGLFKLKGFTSWHELFLVSEGPQFDA